MGFGLAWYAKIKPITFLKEDNFLNQFIQNFALYFLEINCSKEKNTTVIKRFASFPIFSNTFEKSFQVLKEF